MPVHLPPEILVLIFAHFILPTDIVNKIGNRAELLTLSRACRASQALRRAAEPLLYRHLHYPTPLLLQALCRRPELGQHVRHVAYDYWIQNLDTRPMLERRLVCGEIRGLAREQYRWPALDRLLRHVLDGEIEAGQADVEPRALLLLTLILCMTPRVERLHLDVHALEFEESDVLSRLFGISGRHVLGALRQREKDGRVSPMPVAPLFRLREMYLRCKTVHGEMWSIKDEAFYLLILFPTLEKLDITNNDWVDASPLNFEEEEHAEDGGYAEEPEVGEHDDDDDAGTNDKTWPSYRIFTSPGSHMRLRHLEMHFCNPVPVAGLHEMLLIFPSLHTLVLEFWISEPRPSMSLAQYGHILREYGTRLRRFELEPAFGPLGDAESVSEESDEGTISSLRGRMPSLEQLRLPLAALLGIDGDSDDVDLCAYLPATLRWFWTSVTVTGNFEAHYRVLARMLDEAALGNGGRLPSLEWVVVRLPYGETSPKFEPRGFDVVWRGDRHVLYIKKPAARTSTPPGWDSTMRRDCDQIWD